MPPTHQVPLFKEKKELRLSASINSASLTTSSDFQSAYAFANKWAGMVNYQSYKNKYSGTQNGVSIGAYYGFAADFAAGYFKDFKRHGVFECYVGGGFGKQDHIYARDSVYYTTDWLFGTIRHDVLLDAGSADLAFSKFFIQPQYGISLSFLDVALSMRFSNYYFTIVRNGIHPSSSDFRIVSTIQSNRNYFFISPAITLRAGYKYLKFQLQFGFSELVSGKSIAIESQYVSVGIQFALAKRFFSNN